MKKRLFPILLLLPLSLLAQDARQFKQSIPVNDARQSTVKLEIPVGELNLKTGSTQLLEANVAYDRVDRKPTMQLNRTNGSTSLTLKQGDFKSENKTGDNKWDISLSKTLLLHLELEMGAGTSKLDLSNSRLQTLDIEAGATSIDLNLKGSTVKEVEIAAGVGELNLDLTGNWNHDVKLEISGGIGEVNLKLPKNTGVRINPTGLGSSNLNGFRKNGSYYQNAAYGKSKHTLTIHVSGGMGSLNVIEG
ncbi:hypothetical protein H7F15_15765 [Pontibacter sp. Tf4]|uniref:toast rack family protein n=1 Tax=Pontibacter sp. Tf4 TaxID=2761620 RepID=UPI0016270E57|nr:toast rack family protein [Pontibacter sp. Tf4]MBB6612502.1 hypothetical protein [Pontibacter sp. Tf4]